VNTGAAAELPDEPRARTVVCDTTGEAIMNRTRINLCVDVAAITAFLFLAVTGVMLHFVLPPGSHAAKFLGLGRHAWGDVHFWVAVLLVCIIGVHLALHWRWIVCTVGLRRGSGRRSARHTSSTFGERSASSYARQ
jgi:cytochrome b subunit of formate dehydrogenase